MPGRPVTYLARAGASLRPYFYRNYLFVAETGPTYEATQASLDPAYRFSFPVESSQLSDVALRDVTTTASSLRARQASGEQIGLVVWRDRVVHRSLLQRRGTAPMEGDRKAFELRESDRYIHSCYTSPEQRGKGLYAAMLQHILSALSATDPGLRVYIACRQENEASVRAIRRAGFVYAKSSQVFGVASGRVRYRRWYIDDPFPAGPSTAATGVPEGRQKE